ncbi:MAG: nicotinate (nicotinamide) nucleotide adenylyltransferase [Spirochaetes bacterium]|nr:nicotinate (nicotinamide) nucleotide adenylyltransferase [Spirochaetota bacterium]
MKVWKKIRARTRSVRTAIFGGTFNPLHIGHLCIAEEVLHALPCDRVLFVPANIPPHKALEDPGAALRYEMLKRSLACDPRFAFDDCEIKRRGISYSIDTIRHLVGANLVESKPFLIIGDDLVEGFFSWKEYASILEASEIVIVHRFSVERLRPSFPHVYVDNGIFPVSSSLIRARIALKGAWRFLVTPETRGIIEEHGLYGLR